MQMTYMFASQKNEYHNWTTEEVFLNLIYSLFSFKNTRSWNFKIKQKNFINQKWIFIFNKVRLHFFQIIWIISTQSKFLFLLQHCKSNYYCWEAKYYYIAHFSPGKWKVFGFKKKKSLKLKKIIFSIVS